jgi:hypothetical protein
MTGPQRVRIIVEGFINLGVTTIVVSLMDPEFRDNDFRSLELFRKEIIDPIREIGS